ncbi:MAG: cell division protein FtsA [Patescibacteria group bacterium]|nr:cell division protein FtsA [Patescibacteria group bacterium]MDD5490248.1 cell division protein FtsA [Patescibacteria group bacterium]
MINEIITGLDVGSSAVRIVVGQKDSPEAKLRIVGIAEVPSAGVNKGVITSIDDASNAISACLEKAERMVGIPLEQAWVGVSGPNILSQSSKGVVAVSKVDGEIKEEDVERAIEAAKTVVSPPNYEILHVIPKTFTVDGQGGMKDPIGMTGIRLEVDTQIIQGLSSQVNNLTKCIYRTGLDIEDLVFSILAASEAVATNRQKELGTVVINIGSSTTSLIVFEEGEVIHTAVLPIGGDHITADIAIGLRISIDTAEKIKIEYGSALSREFNKKEEINLAELGSEEGVVSLRYVAEIIEARAEEIFDKVDNELKKIDRSGLLPAGAILTGGSVKLRGIVEVAKKQLRLPAAIGHAKEIISAIDKTNDISFTTAVGLVLWGEQILSQNKSSKLTQFVSRFKSIDKATGQIRKWFKNLLP